MKTYNLDGVIDVVQGEGYDEDFPTKQTELLSLSLRQVLQTWKDNDFELVKAETTDVSGLLDELQSQSDDVVGFCTDISEPGIANLPAIPDLGSLVSLITTLLPAILSGSLSIGQVIIILLPNIIEALLALIKREVIRLPTSPGESDIAAQIGELKGMLETNISYPDPFNPGQRISHVRLMTEALVVGLRAGQAGSTIVQAEQLLENFLAATSGFTGLPEGTVIRDYLDVYEDKLTALSDLESIKESLDSIQRWIEEIKAATPVGVMNTSEIDKVIWVRD